LPGDDARVPGFLADDRGIEFSCAACGQLVRKSVGWLKVNEVFVCSCGQRRRLNAARFRRHLAVAEAQQMLLEQTPGGSPGRSPTPRSKPNVRPGATCRYGGV
jgi:hypothetical protein